MLTRKPIAGRYGEFGGCYIPEVLSTPLTELDKAFQDAKSDTIFLNKFETVLRHYAGRETPLTEAKNLATELQGPRIFLKREDLLHTGAHKINNALGQCLLAKKMGKSRIIAETGAGQHGVATATACAYLNLDCVIYMGEVDMVRQSPNVTKMRLLGAEVIAVSTGSKTLKDAVNAALRDYAEEFATTHYCIGSALGPHPFPEIVSTFQAVIGDEAKKQMISQVGTLPSAAIACVGGGSNAIGLFNAFIPDMSVKLIGIEGGGLGDQLGQHAARCKQPTTGILHGSQSYVLQNQDGQIATTHSISAGLDYPAIGPQHAALAKEHRATYLSATDNQALRAFKLLARTEGIIPALESSHALAFLFMDQFKQFTREDILLINLSGRGDKDLPDLDARGLL